MKIVILDSYTTDHGILSWDSISRNGDLTVYDRTSEDQMDLRSDNAQCLIVNCLPIDRNFMVKHPHLKYIGLLCTGYNHIDFEAAKEKKIAVTNIPKYASAAVAQHTMALLLELTNRVGLHDDAVKEGQWFHAKDDCFWLTPLTLLEGKTMGIMGMGAIGTTVADMARGFGMKIVSYKNDPTAFFRADVISLHCPLTPENKNIINKNSIDKMKDGALLINTARGGLIDEYALADALKKGKLAGAGLDVVTKEPPDENDDNPLIGLDNCIITPHMAWLPEEARRIIIETAAANLKSFMEGGTLNRIV